MQKLIPAILTADAGDLRQKLEALKGASEWMHIDIMDGEFVPNTSVALLDCAGVSDFKLEIHLMVNHPERYFEECEAIGAKRVIFQAEGTNNMEKTLQEMDRYQFEKGVALNPETPLEVVKSWKRSIDCLLLMAIHPGAQNQPFIFSTVEKLKASKIFFPELIVGVDGGVHKDNIKELFLAGVDYVVAGSELWKSSHPSQTLIELEAMIQ